MTISQILALITQILPIIANVLEPKAFEAPHPIDGPHPFGPHPMPHPFVGPGILPNGSLISQALALGIPLTTIETVLDSSGLAGLQALIAGKI